MKHVISVARMLVLYNALLLKWGEEVLVSCVKVSCV